MKYQSIKLMSILLLLMFAMSCSNEDGDTNPQNPDDDETDTIDPILWEGDMISFTKDGGADPSIAGNQDRITDNVWLTRGNAGGQIFNAVTESGFDKSTSPQGTLWAQGELSNIANLNFTNFRTAVGSPKSVVGRDLVLYIPSDNIAIAVRFTSWDDGRQGGFAYERSTR